MPKYVYLFKEGNKDMLDLLGGKGANLAEMTSLNMPVPSGFTITSKACLNFYEEKENLNEEIIKEIFENLEKLEKITGKCFGKKENPLLLSVRSGAKSSMPGMMDTILNLGMNDEIAGVLTEKTQNPRFVYDSYRRLIMMYADVVKGLNKNEFENCLEKLKKEKNVTKDIDLTAEDMYYLTKEFKKIYENLSGTSFPENPKIQLLDAVKAVFKSWNNERAIYYRKLNQIPDNWGTAVNVQEMVYGNNGKNSGTGVVFSRNPATGEKSLFGEYLINAQGEDVVAGVRTPLEIKELQNQMPQIYEELKRNAEILETHYKDMQDMEFTIENNRLYMLQTRSGKRTALAAIKIAVDLVKEGQITKEEAILRVDEESLETLLHKTFQKESLENGEIIGKGLPASPGAASGMIYFNAKDVIKAKEEQKEVILVRTETSPEDIEGMHHAKGILTIRGGMTSHAAVVARGMGSCCVSGVNEFRINEKEKELITPNHVYKEGDIISLDGTTGFVYDGKIEEEEPKISNEFALFMSWVDERRKLKIRANADNEKDAKEALKFGAEGIGLVRTEHMFFDKARIFEFRKMILANTKEERIDALQKILPYQKEDFKNIYRVMKSLPVVIRYLDPPLHEFLPKTKEEKEKLAIALNIKMEDIEKRIDSLKEFNPMMGHRGCRLDITYEEIAKMQTRAILEAALEVREEQIEVIPKIMIPLIGDEAEFKYIKDIILKEADLIQKERQTTISYEIGTMIEVPRATLIAGNLAKIGTFFSFGTNDLTQLTYGFSRDDAGKFLKDYYEKQIFKEDPFKSIDVKGVGVLMKVAIKEARKERPNISLGVCGEHGGDPKSIQFCHNLGLDYVSCSPYRIPIARLAAAKAAIRETK